MQVLGVATCAVLLTLTGLTACLLAPAPNRVRRTLLAVFAVGWTARIGGAVAGYVTGLYRPKLAGDISLELFGALMDARSIGHGLELLVDSTFALQTLLTSPGFVLFGAEREVAILGNAFAGAMAGVAAGYILWRSEGISGSDGWKYVAALLALYPSSVYFGGFGLRDPWIYFFMTIYATGLYTYVESSGRRLRWAALAGFASVAILSLRPEMAGIAAGGIAGVMLMAIWRNRQRVASAYGRGAFVLLLTLPIAAAMAAIGYGTYSFALGQLGLEGGTGPGTVLTELATSRLERAIGSGGGGSNYLPIETYRTLPMGGRFIVQVAGLIVLPLPWLINSPDRLLAFADSLVIIGGIGAVVKGWRYYRTVPLGEIGCVAAFAVGIVGYGLIVINSGNAFRLRMSLAPLLFVPAGLALRRMRRSIRVTAIGRGGRPTGDEAGGS